MAEGSRLPAASYGKDVVAAARQTVTMEGLRSQMVERRPERKDREITAVLKKREAMFRELERAEQAEQELDAALGGLSNNDELSYE